MSIITTIESALQAAWGDLAAIAEADAEAAWSAVGGVLTALAPAEWTILTGIIQQAAADLATGNLGDITTAVISDLAAQELSFAEKLGSEVLTALIATISAAKS